MYGEAVVVVVLGVQRSLIVMLFNIFLLFFGSLHSWGHLLFGLVGHGLGLACCRLDERLRRLFHVGERASGIFENALYLVLHLSRFLCSHLLCLSCLSGFISVFFRHPGPLLLLSLLPLLLLLALSLRLTLLILSLQLLRCLLLRCLSLSLLPFPFLLLRRCRFLLAG